MTDRPTSPVPSVDELLEEIGDVPVAPSAPAPYPYQVGRAIGKMNYTHDAMVDLIIAKPTITNAELATTFGYTPSWVSLVKSSNAFRERLAARRAEIIDPTLLATVEERFQALTTRSLEVLQEKLAGPASTIPDGLAVKAAELGARALGLGGNAPPTVAPVAPDFLDKLAGRLVALQRKSNSPGGVQDVEVQEIRAE